MNALKWTTVAGLVVSALAALDQWAIANQSALHLPPELLTIVMLSGTVLAAVGKSILTAEGES